MWLLIGAKRQSLVVGGSALVGSALTPDGLPWWLKVIVVSVLSAVISILQKIVENGLKS